MLQSGNGRRGPPHNIFGRHLSEERRVLELLRGRRNTVAHWLKREGNGALSEQATSKTSDDRRIGCFLRVNRDTLYAWTETHTEFSDISDDIRAEQANRLISDGLSGDYNSTITKLMLAKHGYSDKTENDITSCGKPMSLHRFRGVRSIYRIYVQEWDAYYEKLLERSPCSSLLALFGELFSSHPFQPIMRH